MFNSCLQLSWDPSVVCFNMLIVYEQVPFTQLEAMLWTCNSPVVALTCLGSLLPKPPMWLVPFHVLSPYELISNPKYIQLKKYISNKKTILQIWVHFWKIFSKTPFFRVFFLGIHRKKTDPHPKVWRHLTEFARSSDLDTEIRWITGVTGRI